MKTSNLIGQTFGDRTILSVLKRKEKIQNGIDPDTGAYVLCSCSCGKEDIIRLVDLRRGRRLVCRECWLKRCEDAKEKKTSGESAFALYKKYKIGERK